MESKACFIAGTGTDIGKTYVSALILKKLAALGSAAYYKAAMSGSKHDGCGNPIAEDAVFVKEFAGIEQSVESMCHYVYGNPYSPHLAARVANRQVEMKEVMRGFDGLAKTHDYLIVEGSGGIVCPIRYDGVKIFLADIIKQMNIPCILVADAGLGAINSVVLTVGFMRREGLAVNGIIYNNFVDNAICNDNVFMCGELTGIKSLAIVKRGDTGIDLDIDGLFGDKQK